MDKIEEKPKKKIGPVKIVIISVIAYCLISIIPFAFIFLIGLLENSKTDFVVNNNVVNISNGKIVVEQLGSYYNEKTECFVIENKIERLDNLKKGFFGFIDDSMYLDVTFTLKDKDGYIIGNSFLSVPDLEKNDKWKLFTTFCEDGAKEVASFEVTRANVY